MNKNYKCTFLAKGSIKPQCQYNETYSAEELGEWNTSVIDQQLDSGRTLRNPEIDYQHQVDTLPHCLNDFQTETR